MEFKYVDPHRMEGHSAAHAKAFDSMIDRMNKAVHAKKPEPARQKPGVGSQTSKMYPRIHW